MPSFELNPLASLKVPRNQTAAMQLLQLYAQSGHVYWTAGVVQRGKLARLLAKLAAYRLDRDAPGRSYDKSRGLASSHLVLLDSPSDLLPWVLVSTKGKGGLVDPASTSVGVVNDTRLAGQHLRWSHYELLHAPKTIKRTRVIKFKQDRDGRLQDVEEARTETVRQTTWSWRMLPQRMREHEALIVARAKQRDSAGLALELQALAMMPLFSGVRGQVLKLYSEAKKIAGKFKLDPLEPPQLPYMVKLPVYDTPPQTLAGMLR